MPGFRTLHYDSERQSWIVAEKEHGAYAEAMLLCNPRAPCEVPTYTQYTVRDLVTVTQRMRKTLDVTALEICGAPYKWPEKQDKATVLKGPWIPSPLG